MPTVLSAVRAAAAWVKGRESSAPGWTASRSHSAVYQNSPSYQTWCNLVRSRSGLSRLPALVAGRRRPGGRCDRAHHQADNQTSPPQSSHRASERRPPPRTLRSAPNPLAARNPRSVKRSRADPPAFTSRWPFYSNPNCLSSGFVTASRTSRCASRRCRTRSRPPGWSRCSWSPQSPCGSLRAPIRCSES